MLSKKTPLFLVLFTLMVLFFSGLTVSEADAADSQTAPPALEWLKFVYPEGGSEIVDDMIILNAPDGGYYLISKNRLPSAIFIMKTDSIGIVEGEYAKEAPSGRYYQLESATLGSDGSIVVLLYENDDSSGFMVLLKLRFQENELTGEMIVDPDSVLTKSFTTPPGDYIGPHGCTISPTSDDNGFEDGFIIGGYVSRYFTELEYDTYERAQFAQRKTNSSPYLMRLDSDFNLLWHKVYFDNWNEEITTLQSIVDDVQQTSNGGFIVSASTYMHFTNNVNFQYGDCIFKINGSGEREWVGFTDVELSGPHINGTRTLETRDGDFLGSTHRLKALEEVGLFKFNSNGQKLWEKYYTVGNTSTLAATGLVEDSDGGYIVVGLSTVPYEPGNTYILKVDSSGNKLWELRGPASVLSNFANIGRGAVVADDGGIVVAGVSQLPPVTAPPTAYPAGGMKPDVPEGTLAILSTASSGAVVHYTTDGSTPDSSSPTGESVIISGEPGEIITVKAIAVQEGMLDSDMAVFTYTIASTDSPVAAPEADPAGGVVADKTWVTLTSSTPDALIYYTLDGSDPLNRLICGSEAFITGAPGEVLTLKAVAVKKDDSTGEDLTSDIATFTYTIETPYSEKDDKVLYLLKLRTGLKVELTTSYNSENETLNIEATAICTVYPGDGTVTGEKALRADYQVVDAEGETLLSGELNWNWARGQWEALNVDVSGVLSELAAVEVSFEDDHHNTGFGRRSLVYGNAKLGVSSYYVMPDGHILVYATLTGLDGQRDTSGMADLSVRIAGSEKKYELSDGALNGDLAAQDGQYSRTLQIPGQVPAIIELYLGNDLVDSKIVNVTSKPELAVITDFNRLYAEFRDTGMEDGEDENDNDIADFYDLLECLSSYAREYNGVVYNLSQEIHIENGYISYETLRYDHPADRSLAGELIDSFMGDISGQKSIKNIAIIGDDQVVPFFRRSDPTLNIDGDGRCWEEDYYDDMSGGGQNPTIVDSDRGMIMTDLPYGSYDNVDPDNIKQPRLDAAVGRVFADRPTQLIEIISAYCTPISLHNAAIFQLDKDTVDWPVQVQVTLLPVLVQNLFSLGNISDRPNFAMDKVYLYDPLNCPTGWLATDVTTALQNVYLNMLWTHCDHMQAGTYLNHALTSQDLDSMVDSPGHVMISTGCHSGYSIAHDSPEGDFDYYYKSLVRSMLAKQISYLAPSTYGIGYDQYVAYHDLLLQRFLANLLDPNVTTVGEAHKKAYREYWQRTQPIFKDYFNTYAAYGTVYYGLPTQSVHHGLSPFNTLSTVNASENNKSLAAQSAQLEKIIIDPNFEVSDLEDGTKRFSVYEGDCIEDCQGYYNLEAFAPVMPLIVREVELPLDTFVSQVNLSNYTTSEYPGAVDLAAAIPVNKSKGPVAGTYELPDTYPETIYWWETYQEGDHLKLVLSVIPMQYSKDTRKVTLYEHLEFEIVTARDELWAWGSNWAGQLGDGSTADRLMPTKIDEKGWRAVAAANTRTLALKADGTLWMWGYDDISYQSQTTPIQIGSDKDWAAISAGFGHNLALKTDGTLWAWGGNWAGQIGDGTFDYQDMPTQISDYSDWVAIAAGETHSIAIRADGSLWAWGSNGHGQLGDGTFESKAETARVGSDSDWIAVAAGNNHSLALKADGSLWAWGQNWSGQLGAGTYDYKNVPTQISGCWLAMAAGESHSVAIRADGSLWAWGDNNYGQLGDDSTERTAVPIRIGNDSDWMAVAAGSGHTMALKSDGSLWVLGKNDYGQLGDDSTESKGVPTRIASENIWQAVAAGSEHSVALSVQPESEPEEPIDQCFIATAAFGSKLTPAVKLLRQFRDLYLLTNTPGQTLVKMYYTYSPPIAQVIAGNEGLKLMVRILLLPVIALAWMLMNVKTILLVFIAVFLMIRAIRRSKAV